jgi:hypothetical protein
MKDRSEIRIDSLHQKVQNLRRQGHYRAALAVANEVCDLAERTLGENHPRLATALIDLADLRRAMDDHVAAEPLYRRALQARRAAGTPAHMAPEQARGEQASSLAEDTPERLDTPGKRALYNNLNQNEGLALKIDETVKTPASSDAWTLRTGLSAWVKLLNRVHYSGFDMRSNQVSVCYSQYT